MVDAAPVRTHSLLGVGSLVLAGLTLLSVLLPFGLFWLVLFSEPNPAAAPVEHLLSIVAVFTLTSAAAPFVHLVGFVLGLVGFFQPGKRFLPVLSMLTNAVLGITGSILWATGVLLTLLSYPYDGTINLH